MIEYVAIYKKGSDHLMGALEVEIANGAIIGLDLGNQVYTQRVSKEEANRVNRPLSSGVEAILSRI